MHPSRGQEPLAVQAAILKPQRCMQAMLQSLMPSALREFVEAVRDAISEVFGLYTAAISEGFVRHRNPDGSFPDTLGAPPCKHQQGCLSGLRGWEFNA